MSGTMMTGENGNDVGSTSIENEDTCSSSKRSAKLVSPSAERNKNPISKILQLYLNTNGKERQDDADDNKGEDEDKDDSLDNNSCKEPTTSSALGPKFFTGLEISSGSGTHVGHFASVFPSIRWFPSEMDQKCFPSISEYARSSPNISNPPLHIDVLQSETWNDALKLNPDFIVNINMIHITAIQASIGLFKLAGKALRKNGLMFTYGPYRIDGILTPASNVQFDHSLRAMNPQWGIKELADLIEMANGEGFSLLKIHDMPSNNKLVVWQKN